MKKVVLFVTLLACAVVPAQAQGTIQFKAILTGSNEVPPNNDQTIGTATFALDGNSLSFFVYVPAVTFTSMSGYFQGPALPGASGPVIFDLGGPVFHSGNSFGDPPFYSFGSPGDTNGFGAGPFPLTEEQITQLESGLWDVNITSFQLPDGQLRGQILPLPVFTLQPQNQYVVAGSSVTFTSLAIGTPTPTYQWKFNGANITGGTSSSYTKSNVQLSDAGNYAVVASNSAGSTTSATAVLTVYNSAAATLSSAAYSNNQFQFSITGVPTYSYIIQASVNLTDWTSIQTNTSPFTFTDTLAANYPHRFYRAIH